MTNIKTSHFTGLAGEQYVSYCLAARGYHAAMLLGNAPNIDILVASDSGKNHLSFQVKTSRNAHRPSRFGHEVYEWDVGASAVGMHSDNIWYAFVDLQEQNGVCDPQVFLVPSLWVADFVKIDHSRKMYMLKSEVADLCREQWDFIGRFFGGEAEAWAWANSVPSEARW